MNPQEKDRPMIDWFSTSDGNVYRKIKSWFNQPKCGSVHKFTNPTTQLSLSWIAEKKKLG